jgi:hypothetical protein
LVGFYQNLYHHASNAKFSTSHRFLRVKNLQDAGIDNVFFWINPCRKMYTIISAVLRQQRKSDVFWSLRSQRRLLSSTFPPIGCTSIVHNKRQHSTPI